MKTTLRWKLFGSYLVLVAVMGLSLYAYLRPVLEKRLVAAVTEHLLGEADLAALTATKGMSEPVRDAPRVAAEIGQRIRARVTIMAPDGTVVGDSEVPAEKLATVDNHLTRPEFQQALRQGRGSAIRYSTTVKTDLLYVAVPLPLGTKETGALRLALPLTAVQQQEATLRATLGAALGLAAILALVISTLFAQRLSRPLHQAANLAREIAAGNFSRRLPVEGDVELGNLAGVMNDMSARIEGQLTRLAAEKNRLDAILRGMGEGLMVTDAGGEIALVNPAFCQLFTVRNEVMGRPLLEITRHPALHEGFQRVIRSRSEWQEEIVLPVAEKILRTHWVPLLEGESVQGVVAVFHDISDLKKLERVRTDFVANVSHELRTPVTVIKGYAETLLGGVLTEDPERAAHFVEIIRNHSERLASLIGDLLTLSELESGDFSLQLQPVTLNGIIRHASSLVEAQASVKSMRIAAEFGETPPVLVDAGRIEQVFINLLDNAVKYTPAGGRVTIVMADTGEFLRVSVSDTGPGIPEQSLPRIFERFYRVDAGRSRDEGGTGLGLAIVKHIVQLHGGTVSVESTFGRGTTFHVTLRKAG